MTKARRAAMTGQELRELIQRAGMTQAEAAERIGVHLRTLLRWLSGETKINRGWQSLIVAELSITS